MQVGFVPDAGGQVKIAMGLTWPTGFKSPLVFATALLLELLLVTEEEDELLFEELGVPHPQSIFDAPIFMREMDIKEKKRMYGNRFVFTSIIRT